MSSSFNLIDKQDDLFPIGDIEEVKRYRSLMKLYHPDKGDMYCDCCGVKFKEIPWKQQIFLCDKCNTSLDREYGATHPWQFDKRSDDFGMQDFYLAAIQRNHDIRQSAPPPEVAALIEEELNRIVNAI